MCGIVGYVGDQPGLEVVLQGLRRLEYRGYDSAGVAVLDGGALQVERKAGKLANLEKVLGERELAGTLAIGHTRWATHGPPTDRNAHPHLDCAGKVAVVHNGTIENFEELVAGLEARGHERRSDTDTEVVAHLLEERYEGDLAEAVRSVCRDLEGTLRARRRARRRPRRRRRRPPQPAAGDRAGRRRELPRQRRHRLHRPHPHRAGRRAGPGRRAAPRRGDGHRPRRHRRRGGELPRRLGHRRRREGRLRVLHAQGDRRAAGARCARPSAGGSPPTGCCTSTSWR